MKYFSFKKFDLQVSEEVFPITTDTILLASWVNCKLAKSLLEVGIGSGAISFLLESQNKTLDKVIGIDINKTAIELARQNTLQLKLDKIINLIFNLLVQVVNLITLFVILLTSKICFYQKKN